MKDSPLKIHFSQKQGRKKRRRPKAMGRPQKCCAKIVLSLIPLIHVVMGWSTLSPQLLATSTFREPSSLIHRKISVFDSRGMQRSSFSTSTRLYGVLSRSAILKHKSKNSGQKSSVPYKKGISERKMNHPNDGQNNVTRTFLMDAIEEAIYRQQSAIDCLELERSKLIDEVELLQSNQQCDSNVEPNYGKNEKGDRDDETFKTEKKERDPRSALNRVDERRLELLERITELEKLRCDMVTGESSHKTDSRDSSLSVTIAESRFRDIVGSKGKPCSILNRPKDTWKIIAERSKGEFGRPRGFTGLVFYSPLGVPILVGKPKAESDGILRRVSQGSDLWFQVEDYEGSRVLLRSSLVRGTKNSKRCLQMAADLAAFYSVWGGGHYPNTSEVFDKIPVMYTDSKHVAKRGTKVGRMRKRKSLGRIMGRPASVEEITRGLKPS